MQKILFLLCPTDCLESTINQTYYKSENYFYTSLGNSFNIDFKTLTYIKELIVKHSIKEINFVLSSNNKIVLDGLKGQSFLEIRGMKNFYKEIQKQKDISEILCQTEKKPLLILSYHLNKKINELQFRLRELSNKPIIKGKIYNKCNNTFTNIYSDLVCLETHCLN